MFFLVHRTAVAFKYATLSMESKITGSTVLLGCADDSRILLLLGPTLVKKKVIIMYSFF